MSALRRAMGRAAPADGHLIGARRQGRNGSFRWTPVPDIVSPAIFCLASMSLGRVASFAC